MNFRQSIMAVGAFTLLATGSLLNGQQTVQPAVPADNTKPTAKASAGTSASVTPSKKTASSGVLSKSKLESAPTTLPAVVVTAQAPSGAGTPPISEKYQLPQTSQSTTAEHIQQTVNIVDTEDSVKYFPSLFLRKRNNGDTQAVLATRTWGVNSSARSLVYADDILLSALIGNNNTNGAPRWGLVSPEEIQRIDFLYGPFAAAYPGNSMGGVMQITTKMPEKWTAGIEQTEAFQTFGLYGTNDTYRTDQTNLFFGSKNGDVSWLVTENFQNSFSQPLAFITNGSIPPGTTGTYPALNKLGAVADVVGAGGLLHTEMNNTTGKVSWDITPELNATYQLGFWYNDCSSTVQTYLQNAAGSATYAGIKSFASNNYTLNEEHLANSISLKSDTKGVIDWDLSASNYYYLEDIQRSPYTVAATGTQFSTNGNIARMDGTNWTNADLKFNYRPDGIDGDHQVTFGVHGDYYYLNNPTYATSTWNSGPDSTGTVYTNGRGTTQTEAFWAQDAWRFAPKFKFIFGARLEYWQAVDGYNESTKQTGTGAITSTTTTNQPDVDALRCSPKLSLDWTPSDEWEVTGSFGQAYRFPTVTELYQIVSTGSTFYIPNPNLKPEQVFSEEVAVQRKFDDGNIRLSFFNENVQDALISQTNFVSGASPTTYVTNVNSIRNTGVELAVQKDNVFVHGVDLFGSVTYVNSEILSDPSFVSTTGSTATGKRVPYVPEWRATFGTTYHPDEHWALTAAMRYSGKQYSTLDNSDTTSNVFGAFDNFLVVDLRAQYKFNDNVLVDAGIDNVNNDKYFLYHPFPQRTFVAQVKVKF